ncbi:hypothetical protein GCM10009504_04720 [Pseudomonas laurentiana]|nr:hypothetical protein GCM10009504_04720 [Pseudomonas laurentiana]
MRGTVAGEQIDKGTLQLIDQARPPPFGLQNGQATVALAYDNLRAIDLRRHAEPLDPNIEVTGA